ncbi:MAG: hypothetical protein Q9226_006147 [Calogaya cf. arnoldii]
MSDQMIRQNRVVRPMHYISLLQVVNDTELPRLEWDPEQLEIRIDWKGMYDKFLGEKHEYDRDFSNVRLDAGASDQDQYIKRLVVMLEDAMDGTYKNIRHRRIKRQLGRVQVKDPGKEVFRFEKSARHRLKEIRCSLNHDDDRENETQQWMPDGDEKLFEQIFRARDSSTPRAEQTRRIRTKPRMEYF